MTTLWHYTCGHGRADLGNVGTLRTLAALRPDIVHDLPPYAIELAYLIWATDQAFPNVQQLGLTHDLIGCDRSAYRYRVLNPRQFMTWDEVAPHLHQRLVHELTTAKGALPQAWFVTGRPAEVEYAPLLAGAAFRR